MTSRNGHTFKEAPDIPLSKIEPSVPAQDGGHWPVTLPLLGILVMALGSMYLMTHFHV